MSVGLFLLVGKWFLISEYSAVLIFILNVFLSMAILTFVGGTLEIKSVKVDDQKIVFKFFFGFFYFTYDLSEIIGFNKTLFKNRNGDYRVLLIKTKTGKIYEINSFLISNTDEFETKFKTLLKFDKTISKPEFGLKEKVLYFFLVCLVISFIWFVLSNF